MDSSTTTVCFLRPSPQSSTWCSISFLKFKSAYILPQIYKTIILGLRRAVQAPPLRLHHDDGSVGGIAPRGMAGGQGGRTCKHNHFTNTTNLNAFLPIDRPQDDAALRLRPDRP